jgi:hypothetical protein
MFHVRPKHQIQDTNTNHQFILPAPSSAGVCPSTTTRICLRAVLPNSSCRVSRARAHRGGTFSLTGQPRERPPFYQRARGPRWPVTFFGRLRVATHFQIEACVRALSDRATCRGSHAATRQASTSRMVRKFLRATRHAQADGFWCHLRANLRCALMLSFNFGSRFPYLPGLSAQHRSMLSLLAPQFLGEREKIRGK